MKKIHVFIFTFVLLLSIVVLSIPVTSYAAVKLNKKSITINVKKSYKLKVVGTKKKVKWSSSNKKVATVNKKGIVKGIARGKCRITAKTRNDSFTCKVTVKQPVTSLKLNKKSLSIEVGQSYTLKATVKPDNANVKSINWKSSNEKVATINSKGQLQAISIGTTTITAKTKDGSKKTASCIVSVTEQSISTAKELFTINGKNGTYKLVSDIDLSNYSKTIRSFSGTLNGNGHKILNPRKPLIAENNGTINDITLSNVSINTKNEAGAIAIENKGVIYGCSVSGTITVSGSEDGWGNAYAGGIAGHNDGTIEKCTNNATIKTEATYLNELGSKRQGTWACSGGITAWNNGKVLRCANMGHLDAYYSDYITTAGGIAAANTGGIITNCYNTATISSLSDDFCRGGGIAGFSESGARITNCYNTGTADYGIVSDNRDYVIDCYYLETASKNGSGDCDDGDSRTYSFTKEELSSSKTFQTFDFVSIWKMTNNGPVLQ